MILLRIRLYTKRAFRSKEALSKSKGTVFSTVFIKSILVILELIVRDVGFLAIGVGVRMVVVITEVEVDVSLFIYMNCSFNSGYNIQYMLSPFL